MLPVRIMLGLMFGAVFATASQASDISENPVDTSRWACALCPYRFGWTGVIDMGPGWVSDSSNLFGNYRGLETSGFYTALDARARYRDEQGRFVDVRVDNAGIDSRRLVTRFGVRGRYVIDFGYQEIPRYRGHGAESPYVGVGGNQLTLPPGWQPAPTTGGMSSLAGSLRPVDLEITRKIIDLGFRWKPGARWSYEANYQHQSKEGTRPFGAGVFTINASHFPVPVDFSTDRFELGLNYDAGRAQWRIGFAGSEFDNAVRSVAWDNPFSPLPGTELLRTSLEPDNRYYRFDIAGAWRPSARLRLSGSAAVGRMEQDDPLLPWSINPEFSDLPLPRLTAATRIDVGTLDLSGKLTARLAPRLDLTARLEHDERDNQTPVDLWAPVTTDFLQRDPRPNRPYSFQRDRGSLALRYRSRGGLRLQSGLQWESFERSLQAVAKTDEIEWFAQASLSPAEHVDLRARLERGDRDGHPYIEVPDFGLAEHPLMRKFHLADRATERRRLDIDYYPHPDVTLNLAYRHSENDYEQSFLGLRYSEERSLSLDAGWKPLEAVTAHAFASVDKFDSQLAGAENLSPDPWISNNQDRFLTFGLGLTVQAGERTEIGFDYVRSDADGDILTDSGAGEAPFPTLVTELGNLQLRLDYRVNDRWGLKFHVEHERYASTDWALDGIGPDGLSNVLSFGSGSPDYSVTLLRVQASFRF